MKSCSCLCISALRWAITVSCNCVSVNCTAHERCVRGLHVIAARCRLATRTTRAVQGIGNSRRDSDGTHALEKDFCSFRNRRIMCLIGIRCASRQPKSRVLICHVHVATHTALADCLHSSFAQFRTNAYMYLVYLVHCSAENKPFILENEQSRFPKHAFASCRSCICYSKIAESVIS